MSAAKDRRTAVWLRALRTLLFVGAMIAVVVVVGEQIRPRHGETTAHATHGHGVLAQVRADSHDVRFATPLTLPAHARPTDVVVRTLASYRSRRAYPGAPPVVPHAIDPDVFRTQDCNACHERGGYVEKFAAWTPITPHPQWDNCLQCHARAESMPAAFAASTFTSDAWPSLGRAALPGGPPPIPHTLQLRENCLACHAGPAAPLEIRCTHPERTNCVQCHVAPAPVPAFTRTAGASR